MKRQVLILGAVMVWCVSTSAHAQPTSSKEPPVTVYVVRKDRLILTNPQRDALTLSTVVAPALKLADITGKTFETRADCGDRENCTPEQIVDAFFDYYPDKFRETSKVLADWVRQNNRRAFEKERVPAGEFIDLPCLPASPQQDRPTEYGSRLFEPCSQSYSLSRTGVFEQPVRSVTEIVPGDFRRAASETIEPLTPDAYRIKYGHPNAPLPPEFARVFTARGDINDPVSKLLNVSFLASGVAPDDEDCRATPYRAHWEARRATLDHNAIKIDAAKLSLRLVLIDWDFLSVDGHGKKVRAAALRALQCLGLSSLMTPTDLDLHPKRNGAQLERIVRQACADDTTCDPAKEASFAANICGHRTQTPRVDVTSAETDYLDALCWIRTHDPPQGLVQKVDQFLLRAVFEDVLKSGAWMNVSFELRRDEAAAIHHAVDTRPKSRSMIFAAAGNAGKVSVTLSPQGLARDRPGRVVNITFGKPDGTIDGATSNDDIDSLTEVAVLAPGAGFRHDDFPAGTVGSSFASPWVAAAAWAKRIVDKTKREDIRAQLIRASRSVRADIGAKVTSGGYFDPYLLLVQDRPRLIAADRETLLAVAGGRISYQFVDKANGGITNTGVIEFCSESDADYSLFRTTEGKTFLWKRPRNAASQMLEILSLTATLHEDDVPAPALDLEAFLQKYGEFTTLKVCS